MGGWWFICLVAAVVVLALSVGRAAADGEFLLCFDALTELLDCSEYLENKAPKPSADCCAAVKDVDEVATASRANRQDLCECFRESGRDSLPDLKTLRAQQLPNLCHASDNIKFGPNVKCNDLVF